MALLSFLLAVSPSAQAASWTVDPSGAGDFETIQAAIDAATDGDVVLVAAGAYEEAIDFGGRAIEVSSESGSSATTIDALGADACAVSLVSGEGSGALLSGFTIHNSGERALCLSSADATFTDLRIEDAGSSGAAVEGGRRLDLRGRADLRHGRL